MNLLNPISFTGQNDGPDLLVLATIHGNETCGLKAIRKIFDDIRNGDIIIKNGKVTFVDESNPKAVELGQRYFESNLNRRLFPKDNPVTYEDRIANELCPLIASADYLLDLHSYRRGGPAFGFISPERSAEEMQLIKFCQVPYAVFGFDDAYRAANVPVDEREAMGTREYGLTQGTKGITLECGQHDDPESVRIAYNAILNTLEGLGIAEISPALRMQKEFENAALVVQMKHVFYKEKPGLLARPWENFEEVKAGETLATYEDGTTIESPCDGMVVLPDPRDDMPVDEEWFYIGIKLEN